MPLFFHGLSFVAGIYLHIDPATWVLFFFSALLFSLLLTLRHLMWMVITFLLGLCWSKASLSYPPFESTYYGTYVVEVANVFEYQSHKKKMWRCDLMLSGDSAQGVRAMLFHKDPCPLQPGGRYRLQGILEHKIPYVLMLSHPKQIEVLEKRASCFPRLRLTVRDYLSKALSSICQDEDARMLLGTICFSLPCSQDLRRTIHKVGLDHILGVSGIHFGQLAFLVALAVSFLHRWAFSFVTWSFLTLFFLMIGPQPSVFRAWVSATLCVGQRLLGRECGGLNALGIGLLVLALYDPGSVTTLSLQLSFLATLALLTWNRPITDLLERVVSRRTREEFLEFSYQDQFLYLILKWVRSALSIVVSIALLMVPYQLAYLPDLPLMGCVANLFLPIFFDIALLGTFFVLGVYALLPFLGHLLGEVLQGYVTLLLHIVQEMPIPSWSLVEGVHLPGLFASLLIAFLIFLGLFMHERREVPTTLLPFPQGVEPRHHNGGAPPRE